MKALLTAFHESALCTWCEKDAEGVTVEFDGGMIPRGALCWKCLQRAVKVRSRQEAGVESEERTTARSSDD